ncbi:MAG: Glycosyl transferase family 2, partial [Candidatus Moranbacteria bacterium GW2011_GWF1_44_4]
PEKPKTDYEKWVEKNEKWDSVEIEKEIEKFKYKPKISIITPVYNVDPKWLDKCIESVRSQFYENWELRLHDDASTKKETVECLKKWEKKDDKRIKISYGKENQHISGASNEALKLATGEFVALLDNDDELSPNALFENAKLINEHSEADFIYSDEDKIETNGKRNDPFFKPDWSPDLFLSQMYTCHLGVYRKSIINEIGGFRKGYEGSQDYDLVLRFIEKTKPENIFHIPKILYHWKKIPGSMARNEIAKDYTAAAAQKALKDYLVRNNIEGEVLDGKFPGTYRVKRKILGNPKISIVIPFRDKVKVLDTCVKSILEKTSYSNYEIILVDNQSNENKTADYLKSIKENEKVKLIKYDRPFNFSAINNYATKKCHGDYILFLNNDVEVISPEWLNSMVEHIQRKEVGAVGAKLLYFDNTIQHAGVVVGPGGVAGHAFKTFSDEETGYFSHHHLIKNYNVVTAACILVKKEVFEKVGSFDESNLPVAFNDVDLCLKIREAGYLIVWTPFAKLYHYESLSRGNDEDFKESDPKEYERVMSERIYAKNKWKKYIENDPYYSPNLTQKKEDFSIKIN